MNSAEFCRKKIYFWIHTHIVSAKFCRILKTKIKKAYDTQYSQPVTHVSTNWARRSLTSEIGRDRVYSTWYGRKREFILFFGLSTLVSSRTNTLRVYKTAFWALCLLAYEQPYSLYNCTFFSNKSLISRVSSRTYRYVEFSRTKFFPHSFLIN